MKPTLELTLLSALMAGQAPSSIVGIPPPKVGDFWSLADRNARAVNTWPEWKKAAADRILPSKDEK